MLSMTRDAFLHEDQQMVTVFRVWRQDVRRARDRNDVLAEGLHPSQAELRGRDTFLLRDLLQSLNEFKVVIEVLLPQASVDGRVRGVLCQTYLALEAREVVAHISVLKFSDSAGQETASKRGVRGDGDTELSAGSDHYERNKPSVQSRAWKRVSARLTLLCLLLVRPGTNFNLNNRDRCNRVDFANTCGAAFRQANMTDESLVDEALENFILLCQRRLARYASALKEVDLLRAAESFHAEVDTRAKTFRADESGLLARGGRHGEKEGNPRCIGDDAVRFGATLDAEKDLVRVGRVLVEEASQKLQVRGALVLCIELSYIARHVLLGKPYTAYA